MRACVAFLTLSLLAFSANANTVNIVIVAHEKSGVVELSRSEIKNLFMGGVNAQQLEPLALVAGADARLIFNTKILGLTESRVQSYWAQMRFSGRSKPPQEFESVDAMLTFILNNPSAIGYVPAEIELPEGFQVIYATR